MAGDGITEQLQACQQKAQELGYPNSLVFIFVDAAISGDTLFHKRPALSRVLKLMQAGDVFIVYRRDRIARNVLLGAQFDELLRQNSVALVCVTQETNLLEDIHKTDLYAQHQREKFIDATRKALGTKAAQNDCIGTVPYGFKRSAVNSSLEACEQEQRVIAFIQHLKLRGYSLRAITHTLQEQEYTSRAQKSFQVGQVAKILKNNPLPAITYIKKKRVLAYGFEYGADGVVVQLCHKEQHVITLCKKLREQKLSYKQIAQKLANQGYTNRAGSCFSVGQIARIVARKKLVLQENKPKGGQAPYGFKYSEDKSTLISHQEEQNILSFAKHLRGKGHSLEAIVREMAIFGYKTRRGTFFTAANLSQKLKDMGHVQLVETKTLVDLPYGFKYTGDKKNAQSVPCPKEQAAIVLIEELYVRGLSLRKIAQELDKLGYKTRVGKEFHPTQIARILKRVSDNKSPYQPLPMENNYETPS